MTQFALGIIVGLLVAILNLLLHRRTEVKQELKRLFGSKAKVIDMTDPLDNVQI